jgi:hypothetical protein
MAIPYCCAKLLELKKASDKAKEIYQRDLSDVPKLTAANFIIAQMNFNDEWLKSDDAIRRWVDTRIAFESASKALIDETENVECYLLSL